MKTLPSIAMVEKPRKVPPRCSPNLFPSSNELEAAVASSFTMVEEKPRNFPLGCGLNAPRTGAALKLLLERTDDLTFIKDAREVMAVSHRKTLLFAEQERSISNDFHSNHVRAVEVVEHRAPEQLGVGTILNSHPVKKSRLQICASKAKKMTVDMDALSSYIRGEHSDIQEKVLNYFNSRPDLQTPIEISKDEHRDLCMVSVIPRFNFPVIFLERIIQSDLPVNLRALAGRVESSSEGVLKITAITESIFAQSSEVSHNDDGHADKLGPIELNKKNLSGSSIGKVPQTLETNDTWGVFGNVCWLDRPRMVDEIHLRRFDGLVEDGSVHRSVTASITIKAPVHDVWRVLTAYESLPEIVPIEQSAVDFLIEQAKLYPGEVTLVALGPLKNIAWAIESDLAFCKNIRRIAILGGSFSVNGNINPGAEATIYGDLEATDVVFTSGADILAVRLNVTHKVVLTDSDRGKLAQSNKKLAQYLCKILDVYFQYHI